MLYRDVEGAGSFLKFSINLDSNLPGNIYSLLEYHHNGEGHSDERDYEWERLLQGEIAQLARDYLAASLGHDLTPLLRVEGKAVVNLNDGSLFLRPEVRYSLRDELTLGAAAQVFSGRTESLFHKGGGA